jgi:membrane protease subunit HflK
MAVNEPSKNQKPDTPPDLDEVLRDLQKKFRRLFGKNKPMVNTSNASPLPPDETINSHAIAIFIFVVLIVVWILSGFFIVDPPEKAAILQFGKYVYTDDPGLHWIPPLVDSKIVVNVQQVLTFPYQAEMLTQDENIVSVDLVVQYRINDLRNYLFSVANPNESLQQATASALRQVIGQTTLDNVLTSGREKVRQQTTDVLEQTLNRYQTGLLVMDINMQPAKPPEEVTAAFDDAIKAREDEQRFKNQAITYANRVVPIAEGNAARLKAAADAYKQQVVLNAQGNTANFLALLPQYQQAPEIMRERMYLDTIQAVLSNSSKVILDTPQNNNVVYLPLDKMLNKASNSVSTSSLLATTPQDNSVNISPASPVTLDNQFSGRPSYNTSQSSSQQQAQGDN